MSHKIEIKTSGDFEDDPQGAMDALDKSGFLVFMDFNRFKLCCVNPNRFEPHNLV